MARYGVLVLIHYPWGNSHETWYVNAVSEDDAKFKASQEIYACEPDVTFEYITITRVTT